MTSPKETNKVTLMDLKEKETYIITNKKIRLILIKKFRKLQVLQIENLMKFGKQTKKSEMFDRKLERIKKNHIKILEMKNTVTEQQNLIERFNSRLDQAKESVSWEAEYLKLSSERNKMTKNEESLQKLWNFGKRPKLHIIRFAKGEESLKWSALFKQIMAGNFPSLGIDPNTQLQEVQRSPINFNQNVEHTKACNNQMIKNQRQRKPPESSKR